MEIGKLYQTSQLYWLLFPSEEIPTIVVEDMYEGASATNGFGLARLYVIFWSNKLDCNVSIIDLASIFMVLEQNNKFCRILTAEGVAGWIHRADWCENDIVEVKSKY
jgi:hypothetical protein